MHPDLPEPRTASIASRPGWAALFAGLILAGGLAPGCACDDPTLRRTLPPGAVVDTFAQAERAHVDVLWVVDDSGSMREEQQNLAENLTSFFRYLDEAGADYRIAVTTTGGGREAGAFRGDPPVLTPEVPDVLGAFQRAVQVGTEGSALEEGFAAALAAFERNPGFLRPGVPLFVVFVSDEDDASFGELRYYWRTFEQLKGMGNDAIVAAAAIVGPPSDPGAQVPGGCESPSGVAEPGDRYVSLATQTGGQWGSICDASFAATLQSLGAAAAGLKRKFFLTRPPDPDTLEVLVHYPCAGRPETLGRCESISDTCDAGDPELRDYLCLPPAGEENGWVYESETHAVYFTGDAVPGLGAVVEVVYVPAGGSAAE